MRLKPMRYKDFVWPHNPEIYQVEYRRELRAHKVPFGGYILQDLGKSYRVLQGEGTFAGEDAYETFCALEQVFAQGGAGILIHPLWPAANAHFVSLQLVEEPLPDYVRYRFAFWEEQSAYGSGLRTVSANAETEGAAVHERAETEHTVYIVKKGDTLWGIAGKFGVSLAALIQANPQIKNPNLIYPGDRVNIP